MLETCFKHISNFTREVESVDKIYIFLYLLEKNCDTFYTVGDCGAEWFKISSAIPRYKMKTDSSAHSPYF